MVTFSDTRSRERRPAGRRRRPEAGHVQRAELLQHHRRRLRRAPAAAARSTTTATATTSPTTPATPNGPRGAAETRRPGPPAGQDRRARSTPWTPTSCPWRRSRTPSRSASPTATTRCRRSWTPSTPTPAPPAGPTCRRRTRPTCPPLAEQDVIRTAFIYNPDTVQPVGAVEGARRRRRRSRTPASRWPRRSSRGAPGRHDVRRDRQPLQVQGLRRRRRHRPGQRQPRPGRAGRGARRRSPTTFKAERGISKLFLTGDFNAYSRRTRSRSSRSKGYTNLESDTPDEWTYNFGGHGRVARPRLRQRGRARRRHRRRHLEHQRRRVGGVRVQPSQLQRDGLLPAPTSSGPRTTTRRSSGSTSPASRRSTPPRRPRARADDLRHRRLRRRCR